MRPIPMPCAMLKVSGIAKMVRTAGAAVSKSVMSISTTDCIMKMPDDDERRAPWRTRGSPG